MLLLLGLACGPSDPRPAVPPAVVDPCAGLPPPAPVEPRPCEPRPEALEAGALQSPAEAAVLRGPWIPVVADLGAHGPFASVETCLDGLRADDALGLLRRRDEGRGLQWVASLDLRPLPPGPHLLQVTGVHADGTAVQVESAFTIDRPPHRVHLSVDDGQGRPLSARVVVTDAQGRHVPLGGPSAGSIEDHGRDVDLHSFFVLDGEGSVDLDPGSYRLLVLRSVLDELAAVPLVLPAAPAGPTRLRVSLPRAVDLPGHLSADLHVHSARSGDSLLPDRLRVASLKAAGLDVVVSTDHNRVVDLQPALCAVGGDLPELVPGDEAALVDHSRRQFDLGHFGAFPLLDGGHAPLPSQAQPGAAALVDAFRERQRRAPYPGVGDDLVLTLNHPRGIQFHPDRAVLPGAWPLFNALGFDPATPLGQGGNAWLTAPQAGTGTVALDVDALEVVNRFSLPLYLAVRRDWFALLDQGWTLTGTGNSDSHAMQVELVGMTTNLVQARGDPLDLPGFVDAVQEGRLVVSTGPVVTLEVEGDRGDRAGPGGLLPAAAGAVARVRVQAASWVPVAEVRLVMDGEVVARQALPPRPGEATDLSFSWPLAPGADTWVLAEAGWPLDTNDGAQVGGDYALVAPGYVPLGFTNPVRLDVDGDGAWTAPGL